MSDAKDLAGKIVAEMKDSAHLFFTPVRVIVTEFSRAVNEPTPRAPDPESPKSDSQKYRASAG
jgi:hypothetical protein